MAVVVYLEVCDHEVPLVMSPVIQATGRRIVHNWVWDKSWGEPFLCSLVWAVTTA